MALISNIDHIAIVVNSLNEVMPFYEDALGLKVNYIEEMPERGIRTAFIEVGQTKIELIEPLHESSEVSKFLEKRGPGIHHVAFKTDNLEKLEDQLRKNDAQLIYDAARPGAHETLVNFIHPKSTKGPLIEIVSDKVSE